MDKRNQAALKQISGILLGPVAALILVHLTPPAGLTPHSMRCIAGTVWVMLWWMAAPWGLAATAMLSVLIYGFCDALPPAVTFKTWGAPIIMLLWGAYLILGVWKESRLIERYAYWALNLKFVAGRPPRLILVFCVACGLISMIIPNIPLTALFLSIALAIADGLGLKPGNPMMRGLGIMTGLAPSIGGIGTPLGGGPNLIVISIIASTLHYEVQFWQWSVIGVPFALGMLLAVAALSYFLLPADKETEDLFASSAMLREKLADLGPVSRYEHIGMGAMLAALLMWMFAQPVAAMLGYAEFGQKMLNAPVVALIAGGALFLVPYRRNPDSGEIVFALSWPQALRAIDWNLIVFAGGSMLFGEVLVAGGVDKWLAAQAQSLLGACPPMLVWVFLMFGCCVLSQFITSVGIIGLFVPFTAHLASSYNLDPVVTCVTVGMMANIGMLFPFSGLPVAMAVGGGAHYVRQRDFLIIGLILIPILPLIGLLVGYFLGPLAF